MSDKAEADCYVDRLVTMRYNGQRNIREYILRMIDIVTKLKGTKVGCL